MNYKVTQWQARDMKITQLSHPVLHVSAKTNWSFIRVTLDDAVTGVEPVSALCVIHPHSPVGTVEHAVRGGTVIEASPSPAAKP